MNKNKIVRLLVVIIGTIIMGIGIEIIVLANQGFDSVSTLILGLMNFSPIPFGRWSQLISLFFLLITFLYKRSMLGIGSIINTLLVGETISRTASWLQTVSFLQENVFASLAGFMVMALGTALYLSGGLGSGPLEGMMFCVCDKLDVSLQKSRILLDFLIVACGFLLGSSLGIGTLFAIFLLGPMIQFIFSIIQKMQPIDFQQRSKKEQLSD